MTATGLDRRIALFVLSRVDARANHIVIGAMLVGFVLSFVVPSTTARVTCLMPIMMGFILAFKVEKRSRFAALLVITAAQTASVWNIGIYLLVALIAPIATDRRSEPVVPRKRRRDGIRDPGLAADSHRLRECSERTRCAGLAHWHRLRRGLADTADRGSGRPLRPASRSRRGRGVGVLGPLAAAVRNARDQVELHPSGIGFPADGRGHCLPVRFHRQAGVDAVCSPGVRARVAPPSLRVGHRLVAPDRRREAVCERSGRRVRPEHPEPAAASTAPSQARDRSARPGPRAARRAREPRQIAAGWHRPRRAD